MNSKVKVWDKTFIPYIPYEELMGYVDQVAEKINADYVGSGVIPVILCVANGSIMFTAELMKRFTFDCELMSIKIRSYSGASSTGVIQETLGLTGDVKGRDVIIVEDIIDTGYTMQYLTALLKGKGANNVKLCTMLFKPGSLKTDLKIDYIAKNIPNRFILGFGMDYNELGRNLKDIYVLEED